MTTSTVTTSRPSRTRTLIAGAVALVAAITAVIAGPSISGAEANVYTPYGNPGATNSWMPTVVSAGPATIPNGRTIAGPTAHAYKNGSTGNLPQKVMMTNILYRSNGGAWVKVASKETWGYINAGQTNIFLVPGAFDLAYPTGYYYYVKSIIQWNNNAGQVDGILVMDPSTAGDFVCRVAYCTPGPWYVTVN